MKLIVDVEKDYWEMLKYNVEHGEKYKPFEIIANGKPYEERPWGEWKETGYETGALGITYRQTQCSNCGWEHALPMWLNFCPNCGAKLS